MKKQIIVFLLCLACGLLSCTRTDSSATTEELTPGEIAEEIHTISRNGIRGNSEKLMEYVNMINIDNVITLSNIYGMNYNQSIYDVIMHNIFISNKTRATALKHVKDMCMQALKCEGIYIDDIDKLIDGHIEYEKNKFGRMNSKKIEENIRMCSDRLSSTGKDYNKLFQANGKIDNVFYQNKFAYDCWLISAIKSVSLNPKGQEMIEDLISIDDKGNVTVRLKGIGKEYTISKDELLTLTP